MTHISRELASIRSVVVLGAVAAALAALGLGLFFARAITRPLRSVTEAAESIAAGNYATRVSPESEDELGQLARAFNAMSETLQAQLAIMTSDRNKLTAILASMSEGVVAVDQNERVVHMNRVAAALLGLAVTDAVDRPIWEVTRIKEIPAVLGETLESSVPVNRVLRLPAEKQDRMLELHASPLRDGKGRLTGAILVIVDTTRLHRLETVRQDFVANVSHELKTPLTVIRGFVETVLADPDIELATRDRFLEKVQAQTLRLSNLVKDLLSLSRLESEAEDLSYDPVDLRKPLQEAVRSLRPSAESHGLRIEVDLPTNPVVAVADEETLGLAVSNLLDNAIKYSPAGKDIRVGLRTEDGTAVIEVKDSGIGIDPKHHDRIFERFYRVDKARSRELGGTGLGLAIVKHAALASKGRVTVDSAPGRGSTFRIHLPCEAAVFVEAGESA